MRPTFYPLSNSRRNGCHLHPRLQCRASNSRGHGPTIIAKRLTDSETFWGVPEVLPGLFCTLTLSASASTCLTNLHQPFTYIFLYKRSHMSDTAIIFSLYHERYLGCCAYIRSRRPHRDFACMTFPSSLIITQRRGVCGCRMEGFCSRLHIPRRRAWIPNMGSDFSSLRTLSCLHHVMVIGALLLQPRFLLVVSCFWLQCSLLISKVLRVPIIPYCVRVEGRIEGVNRWVGGWVEGWIHG